MAERELHFQRSMWAEGGGRLWFLLQSTESGSQNSSAERTLEEKPGFRANLHLSRAYCVPVVVTKP